METEYPRQVEGQFEIRKIIYTYGNYYDNTIARGPVDLDLERFSIKRTSEFPHNGEFNRTDVGFRFSEISGLQLDKNASNWEIRFDYNSKVNNLKLVERGKYFLTIQKSKRGQKNIRQNQKIENLYTELIRAIEFKKKLARRDGTQRDYAEVESWKVEVPEWEILLQKYVHAQLRDIEFELVSIDPADLDGRIREQLQEKFPKLIAYLELQGGKLSPNVLKWLKDQVFEASSPIRQELRQLIEENKRETERLAALQEQREKLEKKKALSAELFNEEVTTSEDLARVEQFKSLQENIDELLENFANWENISGKSRKKSKFSKIE